MMHDVAIMMQSQRDIIATSAKNSVVCRISKKKIINFSCYFLAISHMNEKVREKTENLARILLYYINI